jgi:hypothetical protein
MKTSDFILAESVDILVGSVDKLPEAVDLLA